MELVPTKSNNLVEPIEVLLVTTKLAAQALQVSERTIYNLITSGRLPSIKVGGLRRIPTTALRQFARAGSRAEIREHEEE